GRGPGRGGPAAEGNGRQGGGDYPGCGQAGRESRRGGSAASGGEVRRYGGKAVRATSKRVIPSGCEGSLNLTFRHRSPTGRPADPSHPLGMTCECRLTALPPYRLDPPLLTLGKTCSYSGHKLAQ